MRVRTSCISCHERLDLSILGAQLLFGRANLEIDRAGLALRFIGGCPGCAHIYEAPEIFAINGEHDPACRVPY
jgi:hypothetical protein